MSAVEAPTLPSPEQAAEAYEAMRAAVLAEAERLEADVEEAREMLANAEREREQLRDRYPMFFTDEPKRPVRHPAGGVPTVEQMNRLLRLVAEFPDATTKQLARRTEWSTSWVNRVVLVIERDHGPLIHRERRGRSGFHHQLTNRGREVLNRGGIQPSV